MNYTIIILSLFIFCIFFDKIIYPKFRGFMGEFWVKKELNKLPTDSYKILNDIMIMNDNNTYQIDHIVISKYGIFFKYFTSSFIDCKSFILSSINYFTI